MELTKIFTFDSSHRLINKDLSEEYNKKLFGKCYNPPSHGHTYILHVTVSNGINKTSGMIINFSELKEIVTTHILDKLDHQFLNEVEGMEDMVTTCENLLIWIALRLSPHLAQLVRLTLYETPTSYATLNVIMDDPDVKIF